MPWKTLLFTLELSLFASLVSAQCAPDCNRPDTDSCNYCAFLRLTHTCSQTPFGDCTGCCYATLPPSPPPTAPSPPDITLSHASLYRGELTALTVAGDALQDGDFWALVPCARTFPCDATAARCHLASSYYQMILGGKIVGGAFHQKAPFVTEFSAGVTVGTRAETPVGEYVLSAGQPKLRPSKSGESLDAVLNREADSLGAWGQGRAAAATPTSGEKSGGRRTSKCGARPSTAKREASRESVCNMISTAI